MLGSVSRRGVLSAITGGAVAAIPFSHWLANRAGAQGPKMRYDVGTAQGKAMLKKYARAVQMMSDLRRRRLEIQDHGHFSGIYIQCGVTPLRLKSSREFTHRRANKSSGRRKFGQLVCRTVPLRI